MRSLNEFKAHIQNLGTVKQNRFEVSFLNRPGSWPDAKTDLRLRCESLNIPGSQILTTDYKLYGGQPVTKIPNGRAVDEVQMTFLTTGDMRDKYYFDEWVHDIADHENNNIAYYKDVATDITIDIFNEKQYSATAVSSVIKYQNTSDNFEEIGEATVTPARFDADILPIYSIKMVNAIPTRVEAIQVSWADVDQLLRYTVNFSYETLEFIENSNTTNLQFKHLGKVQK